MWDLTRVASVAVTVALAAGCAGTSDPGPAVVGPDESAPPVETDPAPTDTAGADPTTTTPASTSPPATTVPPDEEPTAAERYRAALDASGVIIETMPAAGASPFSVPEWQIAPLAEDAVAGGGVTGEFIDGLAAMPDGYPSLSFVIAGWILSAETPGAVWAAEVMGEQDWTNAPLVRFPSAVLNLFVHDAVATIDASAVEPDGFARPSGLRRPGLPPGPVCPEFQSWALGQMEAILSTAAQLVSAGVLTPPLGNWIITGGGQQSLSVGALKAVLESALAGDVHVVAGAIGVLGTIGFLASLLTGWTATVTPSATSDRFAVGTEPDRPQTFTAEVSATISTWPTVVTECATSIGIELPDPSGAGSAAEWNVVGLPPFGEETGRDATFDSSGVAELRWNTGREPSADTAARVGLVEATVVVDAKARTKLVQLWKSAFDAATKSGGFVSLVVALDPSALLATLDSVIEAAVPPTATASVAVTFHDQCELVDGVLPDGTWSGPLVAAATGTPVDLEGSTTNVGGGSVSLVVEGGVVTGGEWLLDWTASGFASSETATAVVDGLQGHVSGTAGGPASAPTLSGTATFVGSIEIVSPIQLSIPLDGPNPAAATMTLLDVTCETATATLLPSINESAGGFVLFSGELSWTGTRTG